MATVTIAKDPIVAVELTEFTGYGAEKDWDTYPYGAICKGQGKRGAGRGICGEKQCRCGHLYRRHKQLRKVQDRL